MPESSQDMQLFDVVIIGGGMVGATLACALGAHNLDVALIEHAPPQENSGKAEHDMRVSAVSAGSQTIFEQLGVWPLITRRRCQPFEKMHVWDAGGTGAVDFDCVEIAEPRLGHIVENSVIQSALLERIDALKSVHWICPNGLQTVTIKAEFVYVHLTSGETLKSKLLVGADGANSRVRELTGMQYSKSDYGQKGIVTQVRTEKHHQNTAWQRFLSSGPLAFLPLSDGSCSIVWSHDDAESILSLSDSAFVHELEQAFDFKLGAVTECGRRVAFPLVGGEVQEYVSHRIALIGDAAHTVHPLAGQGVNLGIADAAMLAQVLTEATHDIGSLRVLRRYERARKTENMVMKRALEGFQMLFGNTSLPVVKLRSAGMSLVNHSGPFKRQIIRQAMGISGERPQLAIQ